MCILADNSHNHNQYHLLSPIYKPGASPTLFYLHDNFLREVLREQGIKALTIKKYVQDYAGGKPQT